MDGSNRPLGPNLAVIKGKTIRHMQIIASRVVFRFTAGVHGHLTRSLTISPPATIKVVAEAASMILGVIPRNRPRHPLFATIYLAVSTIVGRLPSA